MLSIVVAMGANRAIGLNNQMPWHMPADLQHFKQVTMGKPMVMGRKTYESIGRPLPGRRNIVISSQAGLNIPGCEVFVSLEKALSVLKDQTEIMIIGGATIFQQCLLQTQRLYLTLIDHVFAADTYFPEWNPAEWQEVAREDHLADANNPYAYSFVTLERI